MGPPVSVGSFGVAWTSDSCMGRRRRSVRKLWARRIVLATCHRVVVWSVTTIRDPLRDSSSLTCLLYTSDAADDLLCVDLGGRRIIKKKKKVEKKIQLK